MMDAALLTRWWRTIVAILGALIAAIIPRIATTSSISAILNALRKMTPAF
jgi:hypothetical protein